MTEAKTTHLYCLMQNRLGAMDRVLNALTHRGILPQRMSSTLRQEKGQDGKTQEGKALELLISFQGLDEKLLDKLVKFLQKQVYTLEVRCTTLAASTEEADNVAHISPKFVTELFQDESQRRMAHAHNG